MYRPAPYAISIAPMPAACFDHLAGGPIMFGVREKKGGVASGSNCGIPSECSDTNSVTFGKKEMGETKANQK